MGVRAVEQAPIAFDDRDIGVGGGLPDRVAYGLGLHEKEIEIAARAGSSVRQPGGIDVVRPLLERRDRVAALTPCSNQADRNERLPAAAAQPRDYDARSLHGTTPSR